MDFKKSLWPVELFLNSFFDSTIIKNSITLTHDLKEIEEDIYKNSSTTLNDVKLDTEKMNKYFTPNSCFEIISGNIGKLYINFPQNFLMTKIEFIFDEIVLDLALKDINTNYDVVIQEITKYVPFVDYNIVMHLFIKFILGNESYDKYST